MTHFLSYLFGKFARIQNPQWLAQIIIKWFKWQFKIDLSDAKETEFKSLYHLFTREVKDRDLNSEFIHPVDGRLVSFGRIKDGQTFLIKGKNYSINELVGKDEASETEFEGMYFYNYYLSPKDYHRVHHFVSGVYKKAYAIKGALYPVAPWFVKLVPSVFAKNYRTISIIENEKGKFYEIMVGALNVGSVEMSRGFFSYSDKTVNVGGHLGTFALGSSVVLISMCKLNVECGTVRFAQGISF